MSTTAIKPISLDAQTADAVDRYQSANERKRTADSRARKLRGERDEARDEVLEALGDADFGALPDGRIVQRLHKCRDVRPQKARTDEWDELQILDS